MDIYVQKDGQQQGPFPESKIRQGIDAGEFAPDDPAWTAGKASWQPLSALINLDTTQPPPLHPKVFPVPPPLPSIITLPVPVVQSQTPAATTQDFSSPGFVKKHSDEHTCKNCGTPYGIWSLNRAMGSGLCVDCSKTAVVKERVFSRPIDSSADALKVLHYTGLLYIPLVLIDVVVGIFVAPVLLLSAFMLTVCSLALCWGHSRIAGIMLLVIIIAGVALDVSDRGLDALQPPWIWMTLFQFAITVKATLAVFKLHTVSKQRPIN